MMSVFRPLVVSNKKRRKKQFKVLERCKAAAIGRSIKPINRKFVSNFSIICDFQAKMSIFAGPSLLNVRICCLSFLFMMVNEVFGF